MTTNDYFIIKKKCSICITYLLQLVVHTNPGYEEMYDKFMELGVDEVYCLSVK